MPDIHTIRLREPWECETIDGRAIWRRSFHWPAGLTAREIVWLVIEGLPPTASVLVNEQSLAAAEDGKFNITRLIAESNRIAITLPDSARDLCPFEVRLEIDEG